jgi:hypothetical protein
VVSGEQAGAGGRRRELKRPSQRVKNRRKFAIRKQDYTFDAKLGIVLTVKALRIFLGDIVAPAVIIGWLLWRYPELVGSSIPWLALGVLWHLTVEICETEFLKNNFHYAYVRWGKQTMAWVIVFCVGGLISISYWIAIKKSLEKLASLGHVDKATTENQQNAPAEKTDPNSAPVLPVQAKEQPKGQSEGQAKEQPKEQPKELQNKAPDHSGLIMREVPSSELGYKKTTPDNFTIEWGTNHWSFRTSELGRQLPFKEMSRIDLGGEVPLSIHFDENNDLRIDAKVYQGLDKVGAVIKGNDFSILNIAWDRNMDAKAFEIVDEHQIPIFSIERPEWDVLRIRGRFVSSKGDVYEVNDTGIDINPTRPVPPPAKLFKYPSTDHLHERSSAP